MVIHVITYTCHLYFSHEDYGVSVNIYRAVSLKMLATRWENFHKHGMCHVCCFLQQNNRQSGNQQSNKISPQCYGLKVCHYNIYVAICGILGFGILQLIFFSSLQSTVIFIILFVSLCICYKYKSVAFCVRKWQVRVNIRLENKHQWVRGAHEKPYTGKTVPEIRYDFQARCHVLCHETMVHILPINCYDVLRKG